MGMDAYLLRVRNKKQPEQENFWNEYVSMRDKAFYNKEDDFDKPAELWYARKFYDLQSYMSDVVLDEPYECGEYVEITKEMLEKMINFATHHKDYFDGFNGVSDLCQALYDYDEAQKNGWIYVYECDW